MSSHNLKQMLSNEERLQEVKQTKKKQLENGEKNKRNDKTVLYKQMRAGILEQQNNVVKEVKNVENKQKK